MLEEVRPKLHPVTQRRLIYVECSVLICLAIAILSGVFGIYGAQKTFEAFDGNCIYTWNISFVSRIDTLSLDQQPSTSFIMTTTSSSMKAATPTIAPTSAITTARTTIEPSTIANIVNSTPNATANSEDTANKARKIKHIFRSFEPNDEIDERPETELENESHDVRISREQVISEADYVFLTTMQVDIKKTMWATMEFCDYVLYNQVLSSIAGMLCTTMIVLYNTGGKAQLDWGIPKPWRIVFPAVIAFGIMTVVGLVHLLIMNNAYDEFCEGLSYNLETKTIPCRKLINAFHPLVSLSTLSPGIHYILHITTIRLTLIAWISAFVIMIARMLFVIDFRLVRVTISTFSKHGKSLVPESSSSESNEEIEQKTEKLDVNTPKALETARMDDVSSKEDIDDFQSAHSDVEGPINPTSLEPLISQR